MTSTAPIQRRVETLESAAFRSQVQHEEVMAELAELGQQGREHAGAIADTLRDGRDMREEMRQVKAKLDRVETIAEAIAAHLQITVPETGPGQESSPNG